jgi:hypothetical protein
MMIAALSKGNYTFFEIQSQLRLGLKDYGVNDENIRGLLLYLMARYEPIYQYPINLR